MKGIKIRGRLLVEQNFTPPSIAFQSVDLPRIGNLDELCGLLGLEDREELEWLVAPNKNSRLTLHHYQTQIYKKRNGGVRWIESPRARLKHVQRMILHLILDHVPPSESCFGFVKNRNIKQFVSMHCGQGALLRMDLQDFFPSIATGRVYALWRTLGYSHDIATHLTWLCTVPRFSMSTKQRESVPFDALRELESQCNRDRLPQGAPTSGSLANLIAYRMDRRLQGLVAKTGGQYSRYADDLAFTWPRMGRRHLEQLATWIAACVMECGFQVNFRKTRIMRRGQRQSLSGIIVNDRPNLARETLDNLRATLFNCVRFGPESQNRTSEANFQEYLRGRIAWVEHINPVAGLKLARLFAQIPW